MDYRIMGVFLDVLTLAFVFFPIVIGIHKGFLRRLLSIAVLVVSSGVGYFASDALTPSLYDEYIHNEVYNVCLQKAQEYDPVRLSAETLKKYGIDVEEQQIRDVILRSADAVEYAETLARQMALDETQLNKFTAELSSQLLESAPETVQAAVPNIVNDAVNGNISTSEAFQLVRSAAQSPETAAYYAEQELIRPLVTGVLRSVLFAVTTLVVRLIAGIIIAVIMGAAGGSSTTDRVLGGLIGLLQSGLEIGVLVAIIHIAEKFSSGQFDAHNLGSVIFLPIYGFFFN